MFNFFRSNNPPPRAETKADKLPPLPTKTALPPLPAPNALTPEQKKLIDDELELHDRQQGNVIDGALAFFRLGVATDFTRKAFLQYLAEGSVALMTKVHDEPFTCLMLADNNVPHLAVFSQSKHATPWVKIHPEYKHLIHLPTRTICGVFDQAHGMVLNPGHPVFSYTFTIDTYEGFREVCSHLPPYMVQTEF